MSENTDHLALWGKVEKTPPSATKKANINGQSITAIDTMHMVHLATRQFGPMGLGWGYEIVEERYDEGAPIFDAKYQAVLGHESTHTILLKLWYRWNGEKGEVSQYGHTRYVYRTNKGTWMTDNEAPKKSLSDAMKKCLSLLGFAADIFTGLFDDQDYVAIRQAEERISKADDADAEIQKSRDEFQEWVKRESHTLENSIPYPSSIQKALQSILQRLPDKASMARVDPAKAHQILSAAAERGIERTVAARKAQKTEETANE